MSLPVCCCCSRRDLPRDRQPVEHIFAQQTVAGLAQGAIFGSLALALVLIYRATEVINFAQGELAMATTYIAYQLTIWGVSYWLAFFLTLPIAFALGVVIEVVLIRPIQHSVIAVVIVTVGLFILIDGLVTWKWGADLKFMAAPFGNTVYHAGGVAFSRQDIGVLAVSILSVILIWVLFQFTKVGLAMRAAALRPAAASLVGVRVTVMLAVGWGLAAVLGAVAGMMTEPTQFLQPTMMQAILLLCVRGRGARRAREPRRRGDRRPLIGVFLNLIGQYIGFATPELRLPIAFAVLLIVLLDQAERALRPQAGATRMKLIPIAAVAVSSSSILPFRSSGYHQGLATYVAIYFIAILGLNILTGYTARSRSGTARSWPSAATRRRSCPRDQHWNLIATLPASLAIAFLCGLLVGIPALRLSGVYLALATFALAVSVPQFPLKFSKFLGGSNGMHTANTESHLWLYIVGWSCAAIAFVAAWLLLRGRVGRAFRAVRDSELAAASSGVSLPIYKTLAFGISAAFAGVAGSLLVIARTGMCSRASSASCSPSRS